MSHVGELLSAYLDGELSHPEHREVHEHLAACDDCRAELADLDAARSAVRALPLLDPPVALDVPSLGAHRRSRARRAAAAIAAAAAVLVLGVLVVRDDSREPPVDIVSVVEQHTARANVQPGMPSLRAVSVVDQP
jgi:anti-sigma factor RsiW